MLSALRSAQSSGQISDLDLHFACFIRDLADSPSDALLLAAALGSAWVGQGHVCCALAELAGQRLFAGEGGGVHAPELSEWRQFLLTSGVVGRPGDPAPLILDHGDRLYLARYWHYEQQVGGYLKRQAEVDQSVDLDTLRQGLARLFPPAPEGIDWQRVAAALAIIKRFAVISGGPGTGKTTTVTRLLALLIEQAAGHPPRIALVAPTGKAAARLCESIKGAKQHLECTPEVCAAIPEQAMTLHRLLGIVPGRAEARHHAGNPLIHDVVVVDEASMIDLPMMSRLVVALRPSARLILLGDKDQLASVEAGNVLGDICDSGHEHGYSPILADTLHQVTGDRLVSEEGAQMRDHIVSLRVSHRFGQHSGIGHLARAVNAGRTDLAEQVLDSDRYADVGWLDPRGAELVRHLEAAAVTNYRAYLRAATPGRALQCFNAFRVLCATRDGVCGVEQVSTAIERALWSQGLINARERWYKGRPIMITRNDYTVDLYNGDIGLLWPDDASGQRLRAFFLAADGTLRSLLPQRLPAHETVYAMTVHKSQGSEFDRVLLLLPQEPSPVVTRELLYTGITRARVGVELLAGRSVLVEAVARRTQRTSGLRDQLWS